MAAPYGENRVLESGCSVAERQFRLTFRLLLATRSARVIEHPSTIIPPELLQLQMRKAITFAISVLLIACALMLWTISGVLGIDAHGYGPRIGFFSSVVSSTPYLPIREFEPAY